MRSVVPVPIRGLCNCAECRCAPKTPSNQLEATENHFLPAAPDVTTVVGRPVGNFVAASGHEGVVQGVPVNPYQVNPAAATACNLHDMDGYDDKRQQKRLHIVQIGGQLSQELPVFPSTRQYTDPIWSVLFMICMAAACGSCIYYITSGVFEKASKDVNKKAPRVSEIVGAGLVGCCISGGIAVAYMLLAKSQPRCVVLTALLFGPVFTMFIGIALIAFGALLIGVVLICFGVCGLCMVYCWRHLIPFTVAMVRTVSAITVANPMMLAIAIGGSLVGILWSFIVIIPVAGFYLENLDDAKQLNKELLYIIYFFVVLLLVWGSATAYNVCHVTYCGVFGRWFFNRDCGYRLRMSFIAAVTTSLGSICLGSFLIAVVRALETIVRLMRKDAQSDGNIVCCIFLCLVECFLSCIGDLMDYFSEWAYVQVAVRGVSFFQAVKITFSLCKCGHIDYIVCDLLINSVVNLGALLCGASGAIGGGIAGFAMGGGFKVYVGSLVGLWSGILAGGSAVGVITSGTKTILVLWAESPANLQQHRGDGLDMSGIHDTFVNSIGKRV